ncbi:MAG: hypothetical protein LJE69_03815 [Thiohalocapsa sp.]|jgi:hypothetical protein|uniref:hypothetical protein n=1 Tax=Thiohalocapsa sp. TaxID=2497641 RepID=UPI0025D220D9|nr:hypothetical protein [Thiohalocapsa sp.]MCG6940362.1 hypothetical protein [Thiohalocapsa sp.]
MAQNRNLRPRAALQACMLALVLGCVAPVACAIDEELLTDADRALLVEAVESAFELDLYNTRCRNDQSGRHTENLNKELVSRFQMTVLDVLDDLFPEGYYRDAQDRMQEKFLTRLRDMGGCAGAKAAGLRDSLGARYDAAMDAVAARP